MSETSNVSQASVKIDTDVICINFIKPREKTFTMPCYMLLEAIENYVSENTDLKASIITESL